MWISRKAMWVTRLRWEVERKAAKSRSDKWKLASYDVAGGRG
jgi:hypothetical protein